MVVANRKSLEVSVDQNGKILNLITVDDSLSDEHCLSCVLFLCICIRVM